MPTEDLARFYVSFTIASFSRLSVDLRQQQFLGAKRMFRVGTLFAPKSFLTRVLAPNTC
jgi:hypothetical protein